MGYVANALDEALVAPEFRFDPYPLYRRLLTEDPVYWCEPWHCWILSRYDDVVTALRDYRRFSVIGRVSAAMAAFSEPIRAELAPIGQHYSVGLLHSDPPDHSRLRGLISKAFTPPVILDMRPRVERIVDSLIDTV